MKRQPDLNETRAEHLSDYALIRYRAGELDEADWDRLTSHLDACESCRDRLVEIAGRQTAFLKEPRAISLQAKLRNLPGKSTPSVRNRLLVPVFAGAALTAVAVLVWLFALPGPSPVKTTPGAAPRELTKGGSVMWVVERKGEQVEAGPGFDFSSDDRIAVQVTSPRPVFVSLFSITEQGRVQVLLPESDSAALRIPAGRPTPLPLSLRVTKPIETERVFVLLSPEVVEIQELVRICRQAWLEAEKQGRGLSVIVNLPLPGRLESRLIEAD